MNNQFATQFLREDTEERENIISGALGDTGIDEYLVKRLTDAVLAGHITLEKALEIIRDTKLDEDGGAAAAAPAGGGGSTTGGGVTNGAGVSDGSEGEQYFAGTRRKRMEEDAPMYAHGKANISTYTKDGFTKAPSAQEAGKKIKGVQVKMLWKEGDGQVEVRWSDIEGKIKEIAKEKGFQEDYVQYMKDAFEQKLLTSWHDVNDYTRGWGEALKEYINESRAYSQFKKQTAIRPKDQQMHEAVKMIHSKLEEVSKLVEFAKQMRTELSEGENTLEYKHNTKKIFEKINSKVVEVYTKTRDLK
jgi:hypothetical protein